MNKKLDIIFQIDGKEATEKELENHFIQKINELIEKIEVKKIPLITLSFIIGWIICVIFITAGLMCWILLNKIFGLVIAILAAVIIGSSWIMLFGRYYDIITFKEKLQDAKKSDKLLVKVDYFAKATKLASDFKGISELKDFDFNLAREFLDVQDINKANILEYSFGVTHGIMDVTYAAEDGRVKTSYLRVDEMYESTAVTNDTLICSEQALICQKVYHKN